MSIIGASVKEAYVTLLDLSVALQMISYLYVFAALCRHAFSTAPLSGFFPRWVLRLASIAGISIMTLGLVMVFVPSGQISSIWAFEAQMVITLGALLAVAVGLFLYYS
jgi:hypothetical protein